jgi:hypothetical protein
MTFKRVQFAIGVLAALAVVAIFIVSPWLAADRLSAALRSGDPAAIERMVDFPAVRSSLSSQLTAKLNHEMASDPEAAANPFSGLVTLLAPALVTQVVNFVVTPEGLAKLSREAQRADAVDRAGRPKGWKKAHPNREPQVKPALAYTGLNTFTVTYDSPGKGRMVWVLGREKFFFWKLKSIEVSQIVLDDLGSQTRPDSR